MAREGAAKPINDETHASEKDGARKQKPAEMTAPKSQRAASEKALEMKEAAGSQTQKPDDRTSHEGLHPIENKDQAPSGALDHGGALPAMQRSKFARQ